MKRFLSLLMALVMLLSISTTTAFADTLHSTGTKDIDVSAKVQGAIENVVSVNITWESMNFVYTFTGWDSTQLKNVGSWDDADKKITVTNNSNVGVIADATVTKNNVSGLENVTLTLDKSTASLNSADDGTAKSSVFTLTIAGDPTKNLAQTKIGTIHIVISSMACLHENHISEGSTDAYGKCANCGELIVNHTYSAGVCTVCGYAHSSHTFNSSSVCTVCGYECTSHTYSSSTGKCTVCGHSCSHPSHDANSLACTVCGKTVAHSFNSSSVCTKCGYECTSHTYSLGICTVCGYTCSHPYDSEGECRVCGYYLGYQGGAED